MSSTGATNGYRALSYSAAALKGMGDRAYQEDTYVILERPDAQATLAMVADGMGGMQDGRRASRTAVGIVENAFIRADLRSDIPGLLRSALTRANDALYAELHGEGGSTGIVCMFCPDGMYYAGAGDSYLILRRGDTLYQLNRRQNLYYTMCMEEIRRGRLNRKNAERHPERNALVGYLGMKEFTDVDIFLRPMPLMRRDTLLLCSDGIGDVLGEQALLRCLSSSTPEGVCRRIDDNVIGVARRHQDNYTAIVVRCE